ncbi:MAG: hypothetical protein K5924_02825 [Chloroflexi bacterium]|nr:hypothetical protein [Chloroflexota bacterium]
MTQQRANRPPVPRRVSQLAIDGDDLLKGLHRLVRYPARFHAPAVRRLVDMFSTPGDTILDPFCGSGTLLLEASTMGRNGLGLDADPLAAFLSRAKAAPYQLDSLHRTRDRAIAALSSDARPSDEYEFLMRTDLSESEYQSQLRGMEHWVPAVPNLHHWFKRYVTVDLARIRRVVETVDCSESDRQLLRVALSSIIRSASNADPVPVSGLEVTAHMKRLDASGRRIDSFALFQRSTDRAIAAVRDFSQRRSPGSWVASFRGDATQMRRWIRRPVDAVITSPPYNNAVDYYRRHQLEMYWLGLTTSHTERLALLPDYIGRPRIPQGHRLLADYQIADPYARQWERRIAKSSTQRATDFRHYHAAMTRVFRQLAFILRAGSPAVFVVGHSRWNGARIPTTALFAELAAPYFELAELYWYPVKNRYMSYSRHNGASIDREYVLAFRRSDNGA